MFRMIRKLIAVLLCFCILLPLSACGEVGTRRDVLTVCMDAGVNSVFLERNMYDFMYSFRQVTGIEEVELIYLPEQGVERETMIQRIRTELMSGAGPDIFIAKCGSADYALFPYPNKIMNSGFFLPLDDYMENNTEFTVWDRQEQVILEAGRNEEGQQLIPLSYTFKFQVYDKSELDINKPDHPLTFEEALSDPELSALYSSFYNCRNIYMSQGEESHGFSPAYLEYILGTWVDFENEQLLLTEEELFSVVEKTLSLPEDLSIDGTNYHEPLLAAMLPQLAQPFTLLPLYNINGGVTAEVDTFMAINRNTKRAEEAYTFLDFFMREKTLLQSNVAKDIIHELPLFRDAYKEEYPYNGKALIPEAFEEFTEAKEQITEVIFTNELSKDLALMFSECWRASIAGTPFDTIVHETYEQMQRKLRE